MIRGLNHITFAVTDLARSFAFYVEALGCRPVARWSNGAYLTAGGVWLALVVEDDVNPTGRTDYSHIAFTCAPDDFAAMSERLRAAGADTWQPNRSEGDSFYFTDPDGHRLELHVGDLDSRLMHMRSHPWDSIEFF